jgi:hypothetical protein
MRIQEFATVEEQINLLKLISDSVWKSISVQAQEQELTAKQAHQKQNNIPKISRPRSSAPKPPKVAKPSNFVLKPQLKQFEKAGLVETDRNLKLVTSNDRFALLTLF